MLTDGSLLHAYARDRDETCFAELVRRHVDLVHSAALRRVGGDPHRAQEVTQRVFIDLARKAASLAEHPALGAWLHRSTRFAASNLMREERRRRAREEMFAEEAVVEPATTEAPDEDWQALERVLDTALDELGETDRRAVVLRYFTGASYSEIGARLGVGENAAQMRTTRALAKLRHALDRRGVRSTAATLGVMLAGNAVVAAPPAVSSGALAAAQAGALGVGGLAAGFANSFVIMSTSKTVTGMVLAAALVGAGAGFVTARSTQPAITPAAIAEAGAGAKPAPATVAADSEALRDAQADKARISDALAASQARLEEQARVIAEQSTRLARFEAAEKAANARRVFKNLDELGKYSAEVSLRALEVVRRYGKARPKEGTPEHKRMMEEFTKITEDSSLLVQDPLFLEEMSSADPKRMTALQLAYIGEMLRLDETQRATFTEAVESGYREAYANKVEWAAQNPELVRINKAAVAKVRETLTPAQLQIWEEARFNRILFNFGVGTP